MILRLGLLAVILGATAPLSTRLMGFPWATPYVPLLPLLFLSIVFWNSRPRRIIQRREEYMLIAAQLLILVFAVLSNDPIEALGLSAVAGYATILYWTTRYLLKTRFVSGSNLVCVAATVMIVQIGLAFIQFLTKQSIGVVPSYFGENLSQGVGATISGGVRVSGTFSNSNVFSQVLTIYSSIVVSYILFYFGRYKLLIALIITGISLSAVTLSLSRSGVLGAIATYFCVYGYWISKGGKYILDRLVFTSLFFLSVVILGLLLVFFLDFDLIPGATRLTDIDPTAVSFSSRIETYLAAAEIIKAPKIFLFGVGAGQFYETVASHSISVEFKSYIPSEENFGSVHNWFLLIITEHGVLILALYIYALYKAIQRGLKVGISGSRRGAMTGAVSLIITVTYLVPFSFSTTGVTPWLLTPLLIGVAWIQNEYDSLVNLSKQNRLIGEYSPYAR